jgi:diadenylate cyclase
VVDRGSQPLIDAIVLVAPGSPLRDGLDRVLQAKRGTLVVVGDGPAVLSVCTGGFLLDAEFSPQRLSELAKMDGAIVLTPDASRIARANVHLMPRASIPTSETGTRHRTAERLARSVDVPVITVSESMARIAVYRNDRKHTVPATAWLLERTSQALSTLQRFKVRYDLSVAALASAEVEDAVAVRDVLAVLQPGAMAARIAEEIEEYLVELGEDGRLIRLQLHDLMGGTIATLQWVLQDYVMTRGRGRDLNDRSQRAQADLRRLAVDEALDAAHIARVLGLSSGSLSLDQPISPRGFRVLHQLPRVSGALIDALVAEFGSLVALMGASVADVARVAGMGEPRARTLKDGLARLVEATILERYE